MHFVSRWKRRKQTDDAQMGAAWTKKLKRDFFFTMAFCTFFLLLSEIEALFPLENISKPAQRSDPWRSLCRRETP